MLPPFWNFIEKDFIGKPEEYKRAASIYFVLTVRIKSEVLPEIENIISKDIRMFLFFPKILNQNEKTKVLGALCQLPLVFTIIQI